MSSGVTTHQVSPPWTTVDPHAVGEGDVDDVGVAVGVNVGLDVTVGVELTVGVEVTVGLDVTVGLGLGGLPFAAQAEEVTPKTTATDIATTTVESTSRAPHRRRAPTDRRPRSTPCMTASVRRGPRSRERPARSIHR